MRKKKETNLEKRFQELYQEQQELPEVWKNRVHIISCLAWREEQQVWLCEDQNAKRCIIKRAIGNGRELLRMEMGNLKKYDFSFLPQVVDVVQDEKSDWLLRTYIAGDTLWEVVEKKGSVSAETAASILLRLCNMLEKFHKLDPPVIHRDLKPQNIVWTEEDNLFLIDMGTAREYRKAAQYDTVFVGTRQTAAPEQYGYSQTDCRTDIYALGLLYQYLLTGSLEKDTGRKRENLPEGCRKIIGQCTKLDPDQRYQNCTELKKALLETDSGRTKKAKRKKRIFGITTVLIICLAVMGMRSWNERQEQPYQFHSDMIEQAVRMQLEKTNGEDIYSRELEQIEILRICGSHILKQDDIYTQKTGLHNINFGDDITDYGTVSDLTDCSYMKNLHTLILDQQQVHDLTPLSELPLIALSLCNNPLGSLEPLSTIQTLEELYLEESYVVDVSPISSLPALRTLDIGYTGVQDFSQMQGLNLKELSIVNVWAENDELIYEMPLEKLMMHSFSAEVEEKIGQITTLKNLVLFQYHHSDLEPLLELTDLENLELYDGSLTSIDGVENMTGLYGLIIGRNQISDISMIGNLQKLNSLSIEETAIQDVEVLQELPNLSWVRCSSTQYEKILEVIPNPWFTVEIYDT